MTAEIGETSVEEYMSLAASASQGQNNTFLKRSVELHGSRNRAIDSARRLKKLIEDFAQRFGADRQIALYESPGRANLMGMHIDHRGGIVNPVATQERIWAVCSRRNDDRISAVSMSRDFGEGEFSLSDRLPARPLKSLGEWLNWTEQQAAAFGGGRSFVNYLACGPVYSACFVYPWGQTLAGADFLLDSDLPHSAGLSSSSALVIMATDFFLRCNPKGAENLSPNQLLDVYGNGEWYIGTRGGKGDHAAIKLAQRGMIRPMITTPDFQAFESVPFPQGYDIVLYQSGDEANKSVEPFKTAFNAPIIAYQAGEMFLTDYLQKQNAPCLEALLAERSGMDVKHHRAYLGDVANGEALSDAQVCQFLRSLPRVMTQEEVFSRFQDRDESFQDGLQQANEPPGGYHVRDVTAFGLAECARGKFVGDLLADGDVESFAELINISQLGDRVTEVTDASHRRIKYLEDDELVAMEKTGYPLCRIAGDYHVSTPNIDRLVSLCCGCPEVLGARLSGAGLGGMVVVLGQQGFDETLDPILQREYYEPLKKKSRKIRIVPSQGAGFY